MIQKSFLAYRLVQKQGWADLLNRLSCATLSYVVVLCSKAYGENWTNDFFQLLAQPYSKYKIFLLEITVRSLFMLFSVRLAWQTWNTVCSGIMVSMLRQGCLPKHFTHLSKFSLVSENKQAIIIFFNILRLSQDFNHLQLLPFFASSSHPSKCLTSLNCSLGFQKTNKTKHLLSQDEFNFQAIYGKETKNSKPYYQN